MAVSFGNFYTRISTEKIGVIFLRPGHVKSEAAIAIVNALLSQQISVDLPFVIVAELKGNLVKVRVRAN